MSKFVSIFNLMALMFSLSYGVAVNSLPAEEDNYLYQPRLKMGYCEEIEIEGEDVTVKRCVGADMGAPNPENKKYCSGNAIEPI